MADAAVCDGKVFPILGTMTFGEKGQVKPDAVGPLLTSYIGAGCSKSPSGAMIDTARIYQQATPDGDTEATLGRVFDMFPSLLRRSSLATKANSSMGPHFSLSKQSVIEQCNTSLEKLGVDCIDLFYLHSPDIKTDLEDTLDGIQELHKAGKIKEFGLSNYPAWAVVDIWHRCKRRGMVLPTVYQGMYNVLTRDMEREIVPVAREFGLRLYMYNPLAGGLLAGKYSKLEDITDSTQGRFSDEFDSAFGSQAKAGTVLYRARYGKSAIMEGVNLLQQACEPKKEPAAQSSDSKVVQDTVSDIDGRRVRVIVSETTGGSSPPEGSQMASIALRWLIHHSCLSGGDGIILGVSKSSHLVANLAAWQAGPLPKELVEACDAAWEAARPACEAYFRGYGAQPGGIEGFLAQKAQSKDDRQSDETPAKKMKT
eukprot:TRINITY_DN62126_c0_g1_i1.p1 TRINITY_DN62126_c0_g1~~TRINITY_DN62126_c0_g1_i1.p1  ORF type:complete len:426 (+),score=95.75 TRINITY_DN62126_c0_g1_i1:32-1309(+)